MSELTRIEALRCIDEVYPTVPMVLTLGTDRKSTRLNSSHT